MVIIICGCFIILLVILFVKIMNELKFLFYNEFDWMKIKKNIINLFNCVVGWCNKNVLKFNLKKKLFKVNL